jgi:hypothetical protein
MDEDFAELWWQLVEWPEDVQQKIINAVRAIQGEYIDFKVDEDLSSD